MARRDDFTAKTIRQLAQRVGYVCSRPGCGQITIGPQKGSKGVVLLGEAAHICAAASGGPRYDPNMTTEERKSYENGIWLCPTCAALIDRDEVHYSVEMLHEWKAKAENDAGRKLEGIDSAKIQSEVALADDEKIVLCYMISNQLIKASKEEIEAWCIDEEIHKVNLENARLLLSTDSNEAVIVLNREQFREYLRKRDELVRYYYFTVDQHRKPAVERVIDSWEHLSDYEKLFIQYARDNNQSTYGARWEATEIEIPAIEKWENANNLTNLVSSNYESILGNMIDKSIVFESNWTSYGNPKEYTLYKSAREYLLMEEFEFAEELKKLMIEYQLPF